MKLLISTSHRSCTVGHLAADVDRLGNGPSDCRWRASPRRLSVHGRTSQPHRHGTGGRAYQ